MRAGVLTVSDSGSRGVREDTGGPLVASLLGELGFEVEVSALVPDEQSDIETVLRQWADDLDLDLVLTTGGTGLDPRDVTPEATLAVLHRVTPGITEAMRANGLALTPFAALARQVAGQRGGTLIINLPGSPKAIQECFTALAPILPHAVKVGRRPAETSS